MLEEERIDAALEAMARPEPAADAVARVLARTGPGNAEPGMARSLSRAGTTHASPLRPWLAAAATLCLALATMWFVWRPDALVGPAPSASGTPSIDAPVNAPTLVSRQPAPVTSAAHDVRPEPHRARGRASTTRHAAAFVPVPAVYVDVVPPRADLEAIEVPPIAIEDITQTSIDIEPLPALEPIAIAAIPLAPLDADAIDNQEKP